MSDTPAPVGYRALLAPDASTHTVLGATERLRQSRCLMRDQMLELNASSAQAQATKRGSRLHSALLATLVALPVLGPLIDSAATWWADNPLRAVADLFTRPHTSAAKPRTPPHPWAMLLGAAAVGALLMWTRPWRYGPLRRAVYAGLVPQMLTSLLARVSADGLLDLVNSLLRRPAADASAPPAAEQPAGNDGAMPNSTLH